MKEYEKQVTELNNQETFQSFMSYEEDQRLIQNTEKKIAYEEGLEQGTKQGLEQGIEQGSQDKQIEIAKNLINLGTIPLEDISKTTGLNIEILEKMSKK